MKITEDNCIPTGIEAQYVKKGMRVKPRNGPDYPWLTVTKVVHNRTTGKRAISVKGDDDGRPSVVRSDPDFTWYYFAEGWDETNGVTMPEVRRMAPPEPTNVLSEQTATEVEIIERVMLPGLVRSINMDLNSMADLFERKANDLRRMAEDVRATGAQWAPPGFERIASDYARIISMNSSGTTDSCARNIATATGYATLLTVIKPERHHGQDTQS